MINKFFARFFQSILFFGVLALSAPTAFAIDEPHDTRDGVNPMNCDDCHVPHTATYPPPVASLLGTLCQSCHFTGGPAPAVVTHSSRTTDAGYGDWDLDCWACHNPHKQDQDRFWRNPAWLPGDARPPLGKFIKRRPRAQVKIINPMMYSGPETGSYTLTVTTAGGSGVGGAVLTCTSAITGDDCNPSTTYGWTNDSSFNIGSYAATIKITDGSGAAELALGETWQILVTAGTPTGTVGAASCTTTCADDTATSGSNPGYYWPADSIDRTVSSDIVQLLFPGASPEPPDPTKMFVDTPTDGATTLGADDICQVCHAQTTNYNAANLDGKRDVHSNAGADSQPGGNCMACHTHDKGFMPQGGDCTSCHANVQGAGNPPNSGTNYRRQVTSTGGDFERLSHHVGKTGAQIVTQDDCLVCHDQINHMSNADPQVLVKNADTGAQIAYNGTGASVEAFCLSCHDSNGANGDPTPFPSDSNSPLNIATSWAAASHANSTVSELATDKCLACHGGFDSTRTTTSEPGLVTDRNVHGSAQVKMLSNWIAQETPANMQEGICFSCHDGAPAPQNIEAAYNGITDYRTTSQSGALVNQRHDVSNADQAYSGGVVECTNCHNPHMATHANKNIEPATPASPFTGIYAKTNTYNRDGFNFSFQSTTADLNPMSPEGCVPQAATIGPAVEGVHNGDDAGTSGGSYTGTEDQTYNVKIFPTGGVPSAAQITVTSTGSDSSGPTPVNNFDTPVAVGTKGVTISFHDGGSGGTPASVGPAVDPPPTNDDSATSGGTYNGLSNGTYTVTVNTTGRARDVTISYTSNIAGNLSGNVCRPTAAGGPQCAYGTAMPVGTLGVTITITDTGASNFVQGDNWTIAVTGPSGDGVLTLNDTWNITVTAATTGCSTAPEPDMVTFCLVCHDNTNLPAGVTMNTNNLINLASTYNLDDQHGRIAGNNGGNGFLKRPWRNFAGTWATSETPQPYAALQCTTCHDQHGSDNIFHLKTSITVRGTQMSVGGGPGSGFESAPFTANSGHSPGDTYYRLPCFLGGFSAGDQVPCSTPGSVQDDHKWGAWCTFCHDMQSHGRAETDACRTGHMHGGGAF